MALALTARKLRTYASFIKLEHTVFSLPVVYAGAVIGAGGWPSVPLMGLILIAAIGGRVAAMGLNRLVDVEIDRRNPRTSRRELAAGSMRLREGWLVVLIGTVLYVVAAGLISPLCVQLAPIPVILFAGYPYLKRFTSLAHFGLGLTWSMGPLGGWLATAQTLDRFEQIAWVWLFSILWVSGFDIIYATMDEAFDRAAGLHSLPVRVGKRCALCIAATMHALAFMALVAHWQTQMLGSRAALGWLAAISGLFIWQHAVAERNPELAFFKLNGVLGFAVLGFVLAGV